MPVLLVADESFLILMGQRSLILIPTVSDIIIVLCLLGSFDTISELIITYTITDNGNVNHRR